MDNPGEIMRLCRLCLVKDQVNIPIFDEQGDIRQIFLKISSCLPVKVSKEDQLPKSICDGCSNKLDLLYEFRNSSVNAEKALLSWVSQAIKDVDETVGVATQPVAKPSETQVKEETLEECHAPLVHSNDSMDAQESAAFDENSAKEESDEPPPPKRARRTAAVKAQINIAPDSDDEDDDDLDIDAEPLTKIEDESDESDGDEKDDPSYPDVPGTSADDQPGPSGVGKDGVEAPVFHEEIIEEVFDSLSDDQSTDQYQCGICSKIFSSRGAFIQNHINLFAGKSMCCKCFQVFKTSDDLYEHHDAHKTVHRYTEITADQDEDNVEGLVYYDEEEVIEVPQAQYVYILDEDDQNCVNEVVIQEDDLETKSDVKMGEPMDLVNLEHGYMLPNSIDDGVRKIVTGKKIAFPVTPVDVKRVYSPPKPRAPQPRRRHEVPDFSATEFILVEPDENVDSPHYKCHRCEQIFINKFGFFRHIEKGKCYINNCDVCTATFVKNSEFYAHYLEEHTDRAICNFCFRTFMYEKNVKEHILRHLDQFRHRCEECNKGFYTVREYRNHYKNRHMGIRHKCNVCGRSFADEYYFKKHIATHARANNFTVLQLE